VWRRSRSGCFTLNRRACAQEAPKEEKKSDAPTYYLLFLGLDLENIFMAFLSSSCRETAKNAIKKSQGGTAGKFFVFSKMWVKNFVFSFFLANLFRHGLPQKSFNGVFELSLSRNAQKRHTKATQN
jgi:hypothetical protein